MDVHCCNCHSGFIFDLKHQCPSKSEALDYVKVLQDAKRIVNTSVLYRKFIDGTPLENDIAVWMADFVFQQLESLDAPAPDKDDWKARAHTLAQRVTCSEVHEGVLCAPCRIQGAGCLRAWAVNGDWPPSKNAARQVIVLAWADALTESLEDWIVREARAISGPRTHLQDSEAMIQFGLKVAAHISEQAE